ncbi:MAG: MarR family winged helix-turn-helix transcriptional regulator [Bacillota bacterium]
MPKAHDEQINELEELLRQVAIIIRKRGRDILQDFDVTPPQFNALLALDHHGQLTMGELCDHLYLACSTATDLVDRMERNALIERERDASDRRVIRLKIKGRGREIIAQVLVARRKYLATVMESIGKDEKGRLIQAMEQIYLLMTKDVGPGPAVKDRTS